MVWRRLLETVFLQLWAGGLRHHRALFLIGYFLVKLREKKSPSCESTSWFFAVHKSPQRTVSFVWRFQVHTVGENGLSADREAEAGGLFRFI